MISGLRRSCTKTLPLPRRPPPPVGAGSIVNRTNGLIAQGNLIGAARAVVEGLNDYPKNSELLGTLNSIYRQCRN